MDKKISRTKLYNEIYKEVEKRRLTSKLYRDDYWHGVSMMKDCIQNVIDRYDIDVSVL